MLTPVLSVVIATFNNLAVLKRCLKSWQEFASDQPVELIVIEDGCSDGTRAYLDELSRTPWGKMYLRWYHEDDVHELMCTNKGFSEARGDFLMTWQDDMYLQCGWLVPELIASFKHHLDLGLLSLSRGLDCYPLDEPILEYEDLLDERRLPSTIGRRPLNWFRLQEIDIVIRPWVVRRSCIEKVGSLDEAFRPTEWDEADLCYRIRQAGWKVATHGYERVGAFVHLGSSTLVFSENHKHKALRNGLLFHRRWHETITATNPRLRRTWIRKTSIAGWIWTMRRLVSHLLHKNNRVEDCEQDS